MSASLVRGGHRERRAARAVGALTLAVLVAGLVALGCSSGRDDAAPTTTTTSASTTPSSTTTTVPVDVATLRPPETPAGPPALVALLVPAERTLHDPAAGEVEVAAAALAQQVAYRQLGDHPEWDAEVRAAVPADLLPALDRHVTARRALRALVGAPRTTLPAWRIVPPTPVADLQRDYVAAGEELGIPWTYLAAINLVETAMGRIRGTSEAGALGPMQFLPATWAAYGAGGDVEDPHDAIFGAARLLAADGGRTDLAGAVLHYNHSQHYLVAVRSYAELMAEDPLALRALHGWGVYYRTTSGDVFLPVGYDEPAPIPAP